MTQKEKSENPRPPSRAESFLQLLELEKKLQAQRSQEQASPYDSAPSGESSPEPTSSFQSRRKRGSDYPPVSYQGHITKEKMTKGSSSPSLSISVPPSSRPSAAAFRSDSALVGVQPTKERDNRSKGVTFSLDTDQDSDDSSICHSPTWEGFKQQKARKKESGKEARNSQTMPPPVTLKKKPKKLSKNAPRDSQEVQIPANSRRSEPTFEVYGRKTAGHVSDSEDALENGKKSKSRGFFSRIRRGSRSSIDEGLPNKGFRVSAPAIQSHPALQDDNLKAIPTRRPPQVQAVFTAAARAQVPASERRQSSSRSPSRPSSSSSHSRSQSFFSSAFNKLKGPTFLQQPDKENHDPDGIGGPEYREINVDEKDLVGKADEFETQRPVASRDQGDSFVKPGKEPSANHPREPALLSPYLSHIDKRSPGPSESTFSFEPFDATKAKGVQSFDRDAAIVEESRRSSQQKNITSKESRSRDKEGDAGRNPRNIPNGKPESDKRTETTGNKTAKSHLPVAHPQKPKHGASRSASPSLPSPSKIGRAFTSDSVDSLLAVNAKKTTGNDRRPSADSKSGDGTPLTGKLDKSSDYFSFISQAYAPPALELRSPLDTASIIESFRQKEEQWEAAQQAKQGDAIDDVGAPAPKDIAKSPPRLDIKTPLKSPSSPVSHRETREAGIRSHMPVRTSANPSKGFDVASVPTVLRSQRAQPSRFESDRSSSSDYDDAPQSPLTESTQQSSRPQSLKKEGPPSHSHPPAHRPQSQESISPVDLTEKGVRKTARSSGTSAPSIPPRHANRRSVSLDTQGTSTKLSIELDTSIPHFSESHGSISTLSTPRSFAFTDVSKDDEDGETRASVSRQTQHKAHSTHDVPSSNFLPPLKHQPLQQKKERGKIPGASHPGSPLAEPIDDSARPPPLKLSRNESATSLESPSLLSASGAYLQEARKIAPTPPSSSRGMRGPYAHKNASAPTIRNSISPERAKEPIAKMLVECCSCKFFHDMPSRAYECMAKPDSFVEDRNLGVSAAISTTVKCPWCGHGMTTQCCAGYTAVVYLKEKLHGR